MKLYKYENYKEYKAAQIKANKAKINKLWIKPEIADIICERITYANDRPKFGLCHGTRNGEEQKMFSSRLGCEVLGTEISDNASKFQNTIEWDFHRVKDEWLGACDFVYSNSLDHAKNPLVALKSWLACLKPNGLLIVEWVVKLGKGKFKRATVTDPFSATTLEVCDLIRQAGGEAQEIIPMCNPNLQEAIIFARRI